jgi:hypothetical protein
LDLLLGLLKKTSQPHSSGKKKKHPVVDNYEFAKSEDNSIAFFNSNRVLGETPQESNINEISSYKV